MTKKARTGKLYSEVEGEILMDKAPDDMTTKENKENEEKMNEIEDIRASHDVDAIMTDEQDEEIVFEAEHGTNTSTGSDSKDTSSSSSLSDSSSSLDSESDVSREVVCTKVVQGQKYEKPDDWSSDDDAIVVQEKSTKPKANKDHTAKGKHGQDHEDQEANPDDEGFISVKHKANKNNNNKKSNNNKHSNQELKQHAAEEQHIKDKKPKK
jgi:hypothetical protein